LINAAGLLSSKRTPKDGITFFGIANETKKVSSQIFVDFELNLNSNSFVGGFIFLIYFKKGIFFVDFNL